MQERIIHAGTPGRGFFVIIFGECAVRPRHANPRDHYYRDRVDGSMPSRAHTHASLPAGRGTTHTGRHARPQALPLSMPKIVAANRHCT